MTTFRKLLTTGAIAAMVGMSALAVTATDASARTVCNRYGDCWNEGSSRYRYPASLGVRFYGDRDHSRRHRHHTWRDNHEGRGYYRQGLWIGF
ncbi:MAG: hypothetical protein WDN08_00610 [Rhizomicrobium sp.]